MKNLKNQKNIVASVVFALAFLVPVSVLNAQYSDNFYEPSFSDSFYEPSFNDNFYEPSFSDNLYSTPINDNFYEPSFNDNFYEPSFNDNFYEPSFNDNFYEPSFADNFYEPSFNDNFYEPSYTDSFYYPTQSYYPTDNSYIDYVYVNQGQPYYDSGYTYHSSCGSSTCRNYNNYNYQYNTGCTRNCGGSVVVIDRPVYKRDIEITCNVSDTVVEDGDYITVSARVNYGDSPFKFTWSGDTREFRNFDKNDKSQRVRVDTNQDYIRLSVSVKDDDNNRASVDCPIIHVNNRHYVNYVQPQVIVAPPVTYAPAAPVLSSVLLSQVPYTGPADILKSIGFIVGLLLWAAIIAVVLMRNRNKKLASKNIQAFKEANKAKQLA